MALYRQSQGARDVKAGRVGGGVDNTGEAQGPPQQADGGDGRRPGTLGPEAVGQIQRPAKRRAPAADGPARERPAGPPRALVGSYGQKRPASGSPNDGGAHREGNRHAYTA